MITEIAKDIYITKPDSTLDRPIVGIIGLANGYMLFDAGASRKHAQEIKNDLRNCNITMPRLAVISHCHSDHWFGTMEFPVIAMAHAQCMTEIDKMIKLDWSKIGFQKRVDSGTESIELGSILDIEYGRNRNTIKLEKPEISYDGIVKVDGRFGDIIISHIESDHSPGCSVLFDQSSRVLFLGDLLYVRSNDDIVIDTMLDRLFSFGADQYIDSHYDKVMTKNEVKEYIHDYVKQI